jgi:hypothetical protein
MTSSKSVIPLGRKTGDAAAHEVDVLPSRRLLERLSFALADGEDVQNLRFMRALRQ